MRAQIPLGLVACLALALGGCCRPVCRPCENVAQPPIPASAPAERTLAERVLADDRENLFIRYFDVKDLVCAATDELIAAIRRDVMADEWLREPPYTIEGRNGILITRAPRFLLDAVGAYLETKRRQHDNALRISQVVQIHTIVDLVTGEGVDPAVASEAILSGIRKASQAAAWPGWEQAVVRFVGQNNRVLVVKGDAAFQRALDAHLTRLRAELGDDHTAPTPPKAPIRAQPPSADGSDVR